MKRTLAALMSIILLFLSLAFVAPVNTAKAASKQELEEEIERLDGEIAKSQEKLDSFADEKEEKQEYLDALEEKISAAEQKASALETQIQTLDNEIDGYNSQLKQLKNEIAVIQDEIDKTNEEIKTTETNIENTKDELSTKLRTAYINGKESTLKILMGSDSLASFLTRLEMMKRTSEDEKRVINEFKEQATKLKAAKKTLVEDKQELDEKKATVNETKQKAVDKKNELTETQKEYKSTVSKLEGDYADVEDYIANLDKNSSIYSNYIKKLHAEKQAADEEIEEILSRYYATSVATTQASSTETTLAASNQDPTSPAASNSSGGSSGSSSSTIYKSNDSWVWPLGGASCYISSGYGNRSASISGWSFHGGIDIAGGGIYGKPVYASRGGRVITASWGNTGYGNYVMIDHGDGFATLYGHCSSLCVTTGQTVEKGQHIANVGSTGNSTGPHLHFEVRYNGAKQNPLNYVSK
ncbi:MAG: murein hydrolase activator EnvC family protein [Acutalibacteraceae bacterium]